MRAPRWPNSAASTSIRPTSGRCGRRPSRSRSAAWSRIRSAGSRPTRRDAGPQRHPAPAAEAAPPVWVACTRPSSVNMAAEKAIGALSFAYTGPGPLKDRVDTYYKDFEEKGAGHPAINPNILAIGGDLSMMVARTGRGGDQTARCRRRLLLVRHHALLPDRDAHPGRTKVWELYEQAVKEDPTLAYGPGRGAIGSPDTVRQFLRDYEASGVGRDHPAAQPLGPRGHHGVDRDHGLRDPARVHRARRKGRGGQGKAKRLEPVIEKVEARRRPSEAPLFDDTYAFGGLPTGQGGSSPPRRFRRRGPRSTRVGCRRPRPRRMRVRVRPPAERTGR